MTVGDIYSLKLPSITDPEGDTFSVTIENFSKIATFTKFTSGKYVFSPTISSQVGVHNVAIVIKD